MDSYKKLVSSLILFPPLNSFPHFRSKEKLVSAETIQGNTVFMQKKCLFWFVFYFRTSIVKQLTEDGTHHLPAHLPEKFQSMEITGKAKLSKQTTIGDLEVTSLNPKVEGRIRLLNPSVSFLYHLFLQKLCHLIYKYLSFGKEK